MTLAQLWQFARRWLWLFAAATLVAALASYLVSSRLPKVYDASTRLLITPSQATSGVASYNDILSAERLSQTYAEVMKTRPVVEAAAQRAGIPGSYDQVVGLLDVQPVRNTQLVKVGARGSSPEAAASLANAVASVFIQQTQANQSSRFAASRDALGKQVDQLNADMADHTRQLDTLRAQPPSAQRDGDITRLQNELSQLQQSYQAAVRSYEDVRVSEARSSDLVTVAEPAAPSPNAVQPRVLLNVMLAAFVGLLLGVGAAFLLEYLDDRLTTPERVTQALGLHTLGNVAILPANEPHLVDQMAGSKRASKARDKTDSYGSGGSPHAAEGYRLLGANLEFVGVERPLHSLLVTSAMESEGKTTTAANLAIVLAQSGKRVLLIDADLRRPSVHTLFGLNNRTGLTSLLIGDPAMITNTSHRAFGPTSPNGHSSGRPFEPTGEAIKPTRVRNLWVLTSGPLPPNPSELLASARMRAILSDLKEHVDAIVLDSPPALPVSDPSILAGAVDGTLLVVNAERSRIQHARAAVETLTKAGAYVVGAVLNQMKPSGNGYPYYYYGSSPSGSTTESKQPASIS